MATMATPEKTEKPDPDAWRKSVISEAKKETDAEDDYADDALLNLYAEMVEHAIHPEPDSSY